MTANFALIQGDFTQGGLDAIFEIKAFETLDEAKSFLEKNKEKYSNHGHMWSGLTRYAIVQIIDNKYVALENSTALDYGTAFRPNDNIWDRKK